MADTKDTTTDVDATEVEPVEADQPNPAAEAEGEGTATPEEAVAAESGAPEVPVAASADTVYETPEVREVQSDVNDAPVAAQKVGEKPERVTEVPVYEVAVTTDERVDYVIIPPEGRGDATLPIHAFVGAKTPEQVFAEDASENKD